MSGRAGQKNLVDRDVSLARMITWLDGFAELHIVDPTRIEKMLRSRSSPDLDQLWKSVREDVTMISDMPARSHQVKKYSNLSSYARLASIIMVVISFAFIEIYFFHSSVKNVLDPAIAFSLVIGILYIFLMLNVFASRRMNTAIKRLYQENASELSKNRNRIRQTTQILIDKLQRDITSHNLDPSKFKFELRSTKYTNVNLLGQRGSKYNAVVKVKSTKKL